MLFEEVLSSLEDHQGPKAEKAPAALAGPCMEDPHPSRSGVPQKGKRDSSVGKKFGYSLGGPPESPGHGGYP